MRKKQTRFLYRTNQPVHITAYSTIHIAAVAGYPAFDGITTKLHNYQEHNKSISLQAIDDNTG